VDFELEIGEFYTCEQDGFDPVVIWVGRMDSADDIGGVAAEPVVCLMIRGVDDGSAVIEMAPFWQGVVMSSEFMDADTFYVDEPTFEDNYHVWRTAYDQGQDFPWTMTPNEVYAQMRDDMEASDDD
jgi:hypothetical protein